jgi:hemerythrin superfamily protein
MNSKYDVDTFVNLVKPFIKKEEVKELSYTESLRELIKTPEYGGDITLAINVVDEALDVLKSFSAIPIALKYANDKKMNFDLTGNFNDFKNFKKELNKYVKVLDEIEEQIIAKGIDNL